MIIAAIDYSMSSPCITIGSCKDFHKCKSIYFTTKKKLDGKRYDNIYGIFHPDEYENYAHRYDILSEWAMSVLRQFDVKKAWMEGYSMGSKGAVFNIGENGGVLKHKIWKHGIPLDIVPPTQVKKHFTGKGNADKISMHQSFTEKTGVSIIDIFNQKADSNPVSDIVDSYAILDYGLSQ